MSKTGFKRMMRARSTPQPWAQGGLRGPAPACQPPTDEQLANFVAALVNAEAEQLLGNTMRVHLTPRLVKLMFETDPETKRGWLRRHREFQERAERLLP